MITPNHSTDLFPRVHSHTYGDIADVAYMVAAVEHAHNENIPGAVVECGVWRGGMLMVALLTLKQLGDNREVWGYDTFTGMTETGPMDTSGVPVGDLAVPEAEVRAYLGERVILVAGDVRQTLTTVEAPESIAVLRLDVDWYENTMACLTALWPRLAPGGVLLIDDYNHWEGCRKAVNAFLGPRAAELTRTGTGSGMVK